MAKCRSLAPSPGALPAPAFDAAALELVGARAVAIVDVDGDGHQDIVATRPDERPRWLRGSGGRAFRIVDDERFVARYPIYSMAWDDLDGDTDLDQVGATYDAELERYEAMEAYRNFVKTNVSTARTRQRGCGTTRTSGRATGAARSSRASSSSWHGPSPPARWRWRSY